MIRVGRCLYGKQGSRIDPYIPGFKTIVVLTKSASKWGAIGPYELKDEEGHIMENVWQFSKVYPRVDATKQRKSRYEGAVVWEHPSEAHVTNPCRGAAPDNLTPAYWAWRQKGFNAPLAVRYPPGYGKMEGCIGSLIGPRESLVGPVGYIEARKLLYLPLYTRLARRSPRFAELRRMLGKGEKLLIVEVDGPHQESLDYYMQTYGVGPEFIKSHTVEANAMNLKLLLNDGRHPFGHGYCLAAALLGLDLLGPPEPPNRQKTIWDDVDTLQRYMPPPISANHTRPSTATGFCDVEAAVAAELFSDLADLLE